MKDWNVNNRKELGRQSKKEGSVYDLDRRVPLKTAIPLGIQHVLAMFVGNISGIIIGGMDRKAL